MTFLFTLLVAAGSELAFVIALVVGTFLSMLISFAVTAIRGVGRLSVTRAVCQGVIAGLVAGSAGLWTAVHLGRAASMPANEFIWLAAIPPLLGELGYFLNRFSLRHLGRPDAGMYVPLGRLHAAAWVPLERGVFALAHEIWPESDPEEIPQLAEQQTVWYLDWACFVLLVGAAVSMIWLRE